MPYWGSPSERKILRQFWERRDLHTRQAAFHVVVTSYQIVVSDLKYLNRVSWQHMILDEAQAIKSSASMRWKLLLGFSCRNRLLLSGESSSRLNKSSILTFYSYVTIVASRDHPLVSIVPSVSFFKKLNERTK